MSEAVIIRAEWPTLSTYSLNIDKFIVTEGQMVFKKYIITPANNLIYFDSNSKKEIVSPRLVVQVKNTKKPFVVEIARDNNLQDIDVDNADHIACIRIAEQKKVSNDPRGGKMQFLNL